MLIRTGAPCSGTEYEIFMADPDRIGFGRTVTTLPGHKDDSTRLATEEAGKAGCPAVPWFKSTEMLFETLLVSERSGSPSRLKSPATTRTGFIKNCSPAG